MHGEVYCPRFVIEDSPVPDPFFVEALRDLEHSIYARPQSMGDALLVYKATLFPKNARKSIQELMGELEVQSDVEAVLSAFQMWQVYDSMELYKYLPGFDPNTEAVFAQNEKLQGLIIELRNPLNRHKNNTQEIIRTARMTLFIGRVAAQKTLHSEESA